MALLVGLMITLPALDLVALGLEAASTLWLEGSLVWQGV